MYIWELLLATTLQLLIRSDDLISQKLLRKEVASWRLIDEVLSSWFQQKSDRNRLDWWSIDFSESLTSKCNNTIKIYLFSQCNQNRCIFIISQGNLTWPIVRWIFRILDLQVYQYHSNTFVLLVQSLVKFLWRKESIWLNICYRILRIFVLQHWLSPQFCPLHYRSPPPLPPPHFNHNDNHYMMNRAVLRVHS